MILLLQINVTIYYCYYYLIANQLKYEVSSLQVLSSMLTCEEEDTKRRSGNLITGRVLLKYFWQKYFIQFSKSFNQ